MTCAVHLNLCCHLGFALVHVLVIALLESFRSGSVALFADGKINDFATQVQTQSVLVAVHDIKFTLNLKEYTLK